MKHPRTISKKKSPIIFYFIAYALMFLCYPLMMINSINVFVRVLAEILALCLLVSTFFALYKKPRKKTSILITVLCLLNLLGWLSTMILLVWNVNYPFSLTHVLVAMMVLGPFTIVSGYGYPDLGQFMFQLTGLLWIPLLIWALIRCFRKNAD